MTRTFPDSPAPPEPGDAPGAAPRRHSWGERAFVLGGFAAAAIWTAVAALTGVGMETAGAVWLAAVAWTVPASLALALRRGIRDRDWSAFRDYELADGRDERIDAATRTGQYAYLEIAEEHERLMRGD